MANVFKKIFEGLRVVPRATAGWTTANAAKGDIEVIPASGKLNYHDGSTSSPIVTESHTATLTNKTFDANGTGNSITNIENADIKSDAAIAYSKLAALTASRALVSDESGIVGASSVTATELGHVAGIDSNIQDQIDAVVATADGAETDLAAHVIDTSTHGVGEIVGRTEAQTLTNKTLTSPVITTPTGIVKGDVGLGNVDNTSDATKNAASVTLTNKTIGDALTFAEIATPSTPASGFGKAYFKSDGRLYMLDDAGTETDIASGAGAANTTLSNLGTTAINADLTFAYIGEDSYIISTEANSDNDDDNTDQIAIFTGDKGAGTGYSGSITLKTGNTTGDFSGSINIQTGTGNINQGEITLNAAAVKVNYLTAGSVLFAGSGTDITQDNANLFWDNSNKRLGIGPDADDNEVVINGAASRGIRLAVKKEDTTTNLLGLMSFSDTANPYPFLNFYRSRGTEASKSAVANADNLGGIRFQAWDGNDWSATAGIQAHIDGDTGNNDMPSAMTFHTSSDGTQSYTERMRIDSTGVVTISNLTTAGVVTTTAAGVLSSAAIGTVVESTLATTSWPITASQYGDLASISLTAGTWAISFLVFLSNSGSITTTAIITGIGTATGNSSTGVNFYTNTDQIEAPITTANHKETLSVPNFIVTPGSTTTYYLKGFAGGSTTNLNVGARMTAIRLA